MQKRKDTLTKAYMENVHVFADIFNFLLYEGRKIIQPENLRTLDPTAIGVPYGADGAGVPEQKYRDVLKTLVAMEDETSAYLLLGIENQSEIHYAMPVRNMVYDALQYAQQVNEAARSHRKAKEEERPSAGEYLSGFYRRDRILPVVTLVVYFGAGEWDGPRSLHEMLSVQDPAFLRFVPDYKINLIEPAALTEEALQRLETDLREVLLYVKYSRDREKLSALLKTNARFHAMERSTAEMLNAVTGSKLKLDTEKEVIDMCKAIEDMRVLERTEGRMEGRAEGRAEGRMEGRAEGRVEGLAEGAMEKAKVIAKKLYAAGMPEETIAEIAEVSLTAVRQWLHPVVA